MARLGRYNTLEVVRFVDFGAYLDGGDLGEILIPQKYLTEDIKQGDELEVFVYLDSEERYIATTEEPLAQVGEVALMKVIDVTSHGAFVDWGLTKQLFVPFREQRQKLNAGEEVLVFVYVDDLTYRIAGSTRIKNHLPNEGDDFIPGEQVRVVIWRKTPLGYLVVIENKGIGLVYDNEIYVDIKEGQDMLAYIKKIRPDGKIDLTLTEPGYGAVRSFAFDLEEYFIDKGYMNINDKSSPEEIKNTFGVSKKKFKQALGKLFKEGKIDRHEGGWKWKEPNCPNENKK